MESFRLSAACRRMLMSWAFVCLAVLAGNAYGQVRTKKPDRGVYQPPTLAPKGQANATLPDEFLRDEHDLGLREAPKPRRQSGQQAVAGPSVTGKTAQRTPAKWGAPLVETEMVDARSAKKTLPVLQRSRQPAPTQRVTQKPAPAQRVTRQPAPAQRVTQKPAPAQRVTHQPAPAQRLTQKPVPAQRLTHQPAPAQRPIQKPAPTQHLTRQPAPTQRLTRQPVPARRLPNDGKVIAARRLAPPHRPHEIAVTSGETWVEDGGVSYGPVRQQIVIEGGHDQFIPYDGGCDDACDSIGCGSTASWLGHHNAFLSCSPDQWFGSAELLLMFRNRDNLPPLVTTGSDADPDTAGQLDQSGTQVIVGNDGLYDDLTAGGRFMLGTWLDCQHCRSLTLRGWFAGEQSFHFSADQDTVPVLARPFLNVSDGQASEQDTQLVAFPNRATGAILVDGDSSVYGADVSVHQFCYGKYGGTVDVLYGYQYLGVEENLAIASTSTSLDEDFAPVGTVMSVLDSFDIENQFHGAQFGIASAYREGCWSFRSLLKIGFGSLRRSSNLFGQTTTSVDDATATDPNGLLVRGINQGRRSDSTFAWSPEADLTLGWQRYPCFDLTFGYHIVALTDALELSGVIDPELAVNLSDPPTGAQRPTASFRYDTYYVQGLHFGLQYIY